MIKFFRKKEALPTLSLQEEKIAKQQDHDNKAVNECKQYIQSLKKDGYAFVVFYDGSAIILYPHEISDLSVRLEESGMWICRTGRVMHHFYSSEKAKEAMLLYAEFKQSLLAKKDV